MNSTTFVFAIVLLAIGMQESFQQVCSDRFCNKTNPDSIGCAGCCVGSGCNGLAGYCENSKCYCNGCEVKKSNYKISTSRGGFGSAFSSARSSISGKIGTVSGFSRSRIDILFRMNSTVFVFAFVLLATGIQESFQQTCSNRFCKARPNSIACEGCCVGLRCNGAAGYCENSKCYCNGCEIRAPMVGTSGTGTIERTDRVEQ
ncbi:uncharacterized protein LOC127702557 isoform X3 [Mytilus californianus]|uniref:uncharacterized protein LOC127702557 isoform X3 n=1 Tax=Mytilus californianus TaxID=6549 RepID=UPI002245D23C|nr:uncharacterized protein LOC127702557 isoform X3 [Mytilus californianus]